MGTLGATASSIMRSAVAACQTPVIILLLASLALVVICLGTLVAELIAERRHFKVFLPQLLEDLKAARTSDEVARIVRDSGLLMRQKQYLVELTAHPSVSAEMRESLAAALDYKEQRRYDNRLRVTELTSRISPMLGLLGTLIPLGPGILALGEGDTATLSASMLTAFDTTSVGLIAAGFALVITSIRKRWYKDYMVSFESAMEMVLEVEKNNHALAGAASAGATGAASAGVTGAVGAVASAAVTTPSATMPVASPYIPVTRGDK